MVKIKDLKRKLLFTAGYFAIVALLVFLGRKCIFITLFDIPCPGCGMTRAYLSLFSFDFASAFRYHGMFWSMPVVYLYFLTDGKLFKNSFINKAAAILIAVGFLFVWVIKLLQN